MHANPTRIFHHAVHQGKCPHTKPAWDIPYGLGFIFSNSLWIFFPIIAMKQSLEAMKPLLSKGRTA